MGTIGLLVICLVAGIVLVRHARLRHLGLWLLAGVMLACLMILVFHIPLVV
jgi:hypothetical protein